MNILADEQLKMMEVGLSEEEYARRREAFLSLYYRLRKREEGRWYSRLSLRQRQKLHPLILFVYRAKNRLGGFTHEVLGDLRSKTDRPIIFAVTHVGKFDIEVVSEAIRSHYYLLSGDYEHLQGIVDAPFLALNGVIYFNETVKEDRRSATERMISSKKSGSALAAKQKNGDFIGAWAPYGYRKCPDDPHKLEPDEATAPIVQQIFQWRAEGVSITQIARRLNDGGVPSPSAYLYNTGVCKTEKYNGVIWYIQTVKNILSRQVYIGHMVQGTKRQSFYENRGQYMKPKEEWIIVENTHEPLIDRETFDKVQELAQRRNEEYFENLGRFTHLKTTENILKGLIYCADCKRPLVRYKNVSHEKKLWYTFICQTHTNDIASCPKKNIREDVLIPMLLQAIQTQIALAVNMEALIRRVNSSPKYRKQTATLQGKLDAAKKALMRYNGLYDSLYQNYVDKLMTEQEYMTLKRRYKEEAEDAERLIEALTRQQAAEAAHTPGNPFLATFGRFRAADTLTREMAQALIQRVYVDGDSNIEIVFRYRDEYKELCTYLEGRQADA